jgi:hypothetical protein
MTGKSSAIARGVPQIGTQTQVGPMGRSLRHAAFSPKQTVTEECNTDRENPVSLE